MSRGPNESIEEWHQRAAARLAELQAGERAHWERLGFGRPVTPGGSQPVIDEAFQRTIDQAKQAAAELRDAASTAFGERQLLTRLLDYTRDHLREHELSAASVARAHDISVRHLYRVCAESDISFQQWIIARRLEGAHDELASPRGQTEAIFSIAWSWGFSDPRVFSRRFRLAYGVTPGQWQAGARQLSGR